MHNTYKIMELLWFVMAISQLRAYYFFIYFYFGVVTLVLYRQPYKCAAIHALTSRIHFTNEFDQEKKKNTISGVVFSCKCFGKENLQLSRTHLTIIYIAIT